ncbi:LPXTG-protein cell wall anchor protein [Enterococcus faecium]|nr:LPXTG-protein cell wall anchor protein [Enterococcus faecium]
MQVICSISVSYTHLDVYKRQTKLDVEMKKTNTGLEAYYYDPETGEEMASDIMYCLLYTSRCV